MSGTGPVVLVTRPAPEASKTAAQLTALGYRAMVSPLLVYAREARLGPADFEGVGAVALTSAAASRALAEDGAPKLKAYAVGYKTAAAAVAAGFDPVVTASGTAALLAEAIAADLLDNRLEGPLLIAQGRDTAADLPALLRAEGFEVAVRERVVYRADRVDALSEEAVAALRAGEVAAILALSARTAESLAAALCAAGGGAADWPAEEDRATAICLSRAAATPLSDSASKLGLKAVEWVETPTVGSLLTRLKARFPP